MKEIFHIAAPRAAMALPQKGTLREMLFGGTARILVDLLAVPVRPRYPPSTLQARQREPGDSDNAPTFSNLPTEIHCLILDHMEFIEDIVCLGLANPYFWTLARGHLHDYYTSFLGIWAGKRIVCVGEEVKPDDYPPGLFSAEELDTLRPLKTNLLRGRKPSYVQYNTPFALSHFADPSVSVIKDFVDPRTKAWRIRERCQARDKKDPVFAARGWRIIPSESTYFPQDQPWILRNLTTKEFVRSEAIAIKPKYVRGPNILVVGFGEVVMSRTCWSSSPSGVLINNTSGSPKGVWAGHRFDITTLARHEGEVDSAVWSDVSDEVAREIAEIWSHEFGADIRKEIVYWYQQRPNRGFLDTVPP
ncbi:hypothetical protein F4818DRAFT_430425 [Hypoxylon cercidicola]|nr:hypothetical protein F4818DRAFT_430425 [Hypoxylon cercidicola]